MGVRPTFASVTDVACSCGSLERMAERPGSPVVFDALTGEFQVRYGEGRGSCLVIYHCPFCGGTAPRSKRHLLFAVISPEEQQRLMELVGDVGSVAEALERLGKPTRDDRAGTRTISPEKQGRGPRVQAHRTLVYEGCSEVADIWIVERADGGVRWHLQGKYVGPAQE